MLGLGFTLPPCRAGIWSWSRLGPVREPSACLGFGFGLGLGLGLGPNPIHNANQLADELGRVDGLDGLGRLLRRLALQNATSEILVGVTAWIRVSVRLGVRVRVHPRWIEHAARPALCWCGMWQG